MSSMFKRHCRFTIETKEIPITLGAPIPIGAWAPNGFIHRVYLSDFTSGRVDILVKGQTIQSFTHEYIQLRKQLYTPAQKNIESALTVVPCSPYLPVDDIEIYVEGQASGLIVDYIVVETPIERPPILIEQVQFETFNVQSGSRVHTRFLHQVKELIMVTDQVVLTRIQMRINDDLKVDQPGLYFNRVQPFEYHTCTPDTPYVYTYALCTDPESEKNTGSIPMGRIQNQVFTFWSDMAEMFSITIYAVSYNILTSEGHLRFLN